MDSLETSDDILHPHTEQRYCGRGALLESMDESIILKVTLLYNVIFALRITVDKKQYS